MLFVLATTLPAAVFGSDPYFFPQVLFLCALIPLLFARLRARNDDHRLSRLLRPVYYFVAGAAFAFGTGWLIHNTCLFWSATWEPERQVLVLQRLAPLGQVQIPQSQVANVTEYSYPERSIHGRRLVVRFEIETKDGEYYQSGPIHLPAQAAAARRTLAPAAGDRLQRWIIGGRQL